MAESSGLSGMFNSVAGIALFTAAVDIALFVWMHFTTSGMMFGASVADMLGMTGSVAKAAALPLATTMGGEQVFSFGN